MISSESKMKLLQVYYSSVLDVKLTWHQIGKLQSCARKLQRLAEQYCNGDITAEQHEKRESKEHDTLKNIFAASNISPQNIKIEGDPRGYVLRIYYGPSYQSYVAPEEFN